MNKIHVEYGRALMSCVWTACWSADTNTILILTKHIFG